MKKTYFHMLNFGGEIPEIDEFHDFGYVSEIFPEVKKWFRELSLSDEEEQLKLRGIDVDSLKINSGGYHLSVTYPDNNSKRSWICYNRFDNESIDTWNRAHEEAHAVCNLGFRGELERRIAIPNLDKLSEEDFCDQAGLYVLRRRCIKPHPNILIHHSERVSQSRLF